MESQHTARSIAFDILNIFDEEQVLDYSITDSLESRDRARVREHIQGLLRRRSYLDFLIDHFSSIALDEMNPKILNLLRLGIYELLFMDGTPDYAAINESVELAKVKISHKTGDLVNAILRNLQREIDDLPKPNFEDRTKLIATTFSHPEWITKRWVERLGEREAFKLMQANNGRPAYYVRVNNLKTKTENFKLRLDKFNIEYEESEWLPSFFKMSSIGPLLEKGWLDKGLCFVQDIAAGFAPTILDPAKGDSVYDLCAAPGTKSVFMANLMDGEGSITAIDVNPQRLQTLATNAMNYGAEIVKVRRGDARDLDLKLADCVLLDAPCTGTGVLSKRADLRWKRTPEELEQAVQLQEELLDEAANLVSKNGKLVYSTCSLEPEENTEQIKKFLTKYDNFVLEPLDGILPEEVLSEDKKYYQTFPHIHGCDGHFGVLLRRVK